MPVSRASPALSKSQFASCRHCCKKSRTFLNIFSYFLARARLSSDAPEVKHFFAFFIIFFQRARCWLFGKKSRTFFNFFQFFCTPWHEPNGRGAARFGGAATVLRVGLGNGGCGVGTHPGNERGEYSGNCLRLSAAQGCALDNRHGLVCVCAWMKVGRERARVLAVVRPPLPLPRQPLMPRSHSTNSGVLRPVLRSTGTNTELRPNFSRLVVSSHLPLNRPSRSENLAAVRMFFPARV